MHSVIAKTYSTSMRIKPAAVLMSALLLFLGAGKLRGQDTGTITGTVTDASGAVVAAAKVGIVAIGTNASRSLITDSMGRYSSGPLPVGAYRVEVQAPGFQKLVRAGLNLEVQQTAVVDLQLQVGAANEQVTVTAAADLVNTTDASQGQVIDERRVAALPLNGRDYLQLSLLSEGAVEGPGADRNATGSNGLAGGTSRAGGFSAGGQRTTDNNYLLNGFNNLTNDASLDDNQADIIKPSVDAVEEFKVQTNGYSAEFGRAGGGVVNLTLKSGTNAFHGTVYEFLRNEKLDARNFFVPGSTPPFKRNDYGFTIGGPVIKNKVFFFFSYEKLDLHESSTFNNTIPTLAMRGGDFSGTTIYDPSTYNAATNTRQPFPGNIIPANRMDPVAAQLIGFYPTPQNARSSQNFIYVPPYLDTLPKYNTNEDYQLSPRNRISWMFSRQRDFQPGQDVEVLPSPAFGGSTRAQTILAYNTGLSWVSVISPALVTTTKIGWAFDRFDIGYGPDVLALGNVDAKVGLQIPTPKVPEPYADFTLSGYSTIGPGTNLPYYSVGQDRQIKNDTSWIHGGHNLKFGMDAQWIQTYNWNGRFLLGVFAFTGRYTRSPVNNSGGSSVADFLLGDVDNSQISTETRLDERAILAAGYFQDDWKVTPRLTVNLGLRYSYFRPFQAVFGKLANVDLWTNPQSPQIVLASQASSSQFWATNSTNFQPRVGFAYQLLPGKVVLRAGYGIYYPDVRFTPFGDSSSWVVNPPYDVSATSSSDGITPASLLRNGLPSNAATLTSTTPISLGATQINPHWAYVQQWNFNVQYQPVKNWMVQVGYFGTKGTDLANLVDANYVPVLGPGVLNQLRRFKSIFVPTSVPGAPGPASGVTVSPIGAILETEYEGNIVFDSLQAKVEHQFSGGFSVIGSWLWSKGLTDTRGSGPMGSAPGSTFQNMANLRAERGPIDANLGHRVVISGIWDLPYGRGRRYGANLNRVLNTLIGDWSLQGIETFTTGHPFNVTVNGDPANAGQTDRANVVGDWRVVPGGSTPQKWFNTAAFQPNAPYTFGNLGRNSLIGPRYENIDCAVEKQGTLFKAKDQPWNLQFRWEFFNVLNHPNFQFPGGAYGTPTFGQITAADAPRLMQVALKVVF